MSVRNKRVFSVLLSLCLCMSLLLCVPARASADTTIEKVLCSLSYEPVVMMDLQYVTVSSSSTDCGITSAYWTDASGNQVTGSFGKGEYTLNVNYAALGGYIFSAAPAGYINNRGDGVTVSVSGDGRSATLRKTFTATIWTPTSLKDPYNASGEFGGWVSFAASSMYADSHVWFLVSPDGNQTLAVERCNEVFPTLTYTGETTERLNLHHLPAEIDGWKVFCRHWSVDQIGYSDSKMAKITVTNIPTPEPTPEFTPVPLTVPTPEPEAETLPEQASEAGAEAGAEAEPEAAPEPTAKPHEHSYRIEHDADGHWRVCEGCGEVGQKEAHLFVWHETRAASADQPGEETGVCSICGESRTRLIDGDGSVSRATSAIGEKLGLKGFSDMQLLLMGGAGVCVLLLILTAVFNPKRRR